MKHLCDSLYVLVALLPVLHIPLAKAAPLYRFIAVEGLPAPGLNDGSRWRALSPASINDAGEIAVAAILAVDDGMDEVTTRSVWVLNRFGGRLVAREGEIAPGAVVNRVYGNRMTRPNINAAGEFGFIAELVDPNGMTDPTRASGVFVTEGGVPRLILQEGDLAPGTTTGEIVTDVDFFSPSLNDVGHVIFEALTTPQTGNGQRDVYAIRGAGIEVIAQSGSPAPGFGDGTITFANSGTIINASSDIAFRSVLDNVPFGAGNVAAIGSTPFGIGPILQTGQPAPGFPASSKLEAITGPVFTDTGLYGISGRVADGSNPVMGVFVGPAGGLQPIAIEGDLLSSGSARLGSPAQDLVNLSINNAGDVAMTTRVMELDGSSLPARDSGIVAVLNGELKLIVREGDPVPGANDGAVFDELIGSAAFPPAINDRGDMAFRAPIRTGVGQAVTGTNNGGLFFYDGETGEVVMLAREGDLYDLNPDSHTDPMVEITSFSQIDGFYDLEGQSLSLNNDGLLVAEVTFSFSTQISTLMLFDPRGITIPEPTTVTLCLLGLGVRLGRKSEKSGVACCK